MADETRPRGTRPSRKKESFRTDAGRTVYGGGGITPDVFVKAPTLSRFATTLYARGVFFEFAVDYLAKHPAIARDFAVTDAVRDDFFKFVDARPGLPIDKGAKAAYAEEKDPLIVDRALREEILTAKVRARSGLPSEPRERRPAQEGPHALPGGRGARGRARADAAREEVGPQGAGQALRGLGPQAFFFLGKGFFLCAAAGKGASAPAGRMSAHQSTNGAAKQPASRQKCDAVAQTFRSQARRTSPRSRRRAASRRTTRPPATSAATWSANRARAARSTSPCIARSRKRPGVAAASVSSRMTSNVRSSAGSAGRSDLDEGKSARSTTTRAPSA
jgi:hypothetical protein